VVIPSRDGALLLPACLDALARQTVRAARVIVVDDHSGDDSREIVQRHPLSAEWLPLCAATGFPAAANAGLASARTALVALLNNDARPEPKWLEALLQAAREEPDCQAFASRILSSDRPDRIDSAGLALTEGFGQLSIGALERDGPEFDGRHEVLGACAAAALYRKSLFTRIGPFDEELVMYWEDYDIALRAQQAGLRTLYVGAARVRHLGQATIGRNSSRAAYYYHRNWLPVIVRCDPALAFTRAPWIILTALRMIGLAVSRGRLPACLLGLMAGCLLLGPRRVKAVAATRSPGARDRLLASLKEGSRLRRAARRADRPPA